MSTIQQSLPSLLMIVVAIGVAVFAWTRWKLRHLRPSAMVGSLLLWCGSLWILINALETASVDVNSASFWYRVQFLAIVPVPTLWLYLALQFTGQQQALTRPRLLLLSAVAVVCLIMALTNDYHYLFVANTRVVTSSPILIVDRDPGPVLLLFYIVGYSQIVLGTYLLTLKLVRTEMFRLQGTLVMLGVALSVGASILDVSRLNPVPQITLTPIALAIAIPLVALTLIRVRRADIVPVARAEIIETMEDAVLVLDVEHRIIDLNPAAESVIGQQRAAVLGRSIKEATSELALQLNTGPLQPIGGNEIRLGEAGHQRIFDVRKSKLNDWRGQPLSRVIVLRDITERYRSEEALRQSEDKYRIHFAHVNDVIYSFDSQLQITSVSPSVERILGYRPDELIGHSLLKLGELALLPPEYFEKAAREANQVLGGQRLDGAMYEFIARDGTRVTAEISGSPIVVDGEVIGAVSVARDVTERAHTEARLRASLQEKEVLLSEIHHRVKNNMQVVASLLSLQSSTIDDPSMRAQFEDSQNRIRSMALVHEQLYRSHDMTSIDFGNYLRDLSGHLMQGYRAKSTGVKLIVAVDDTWLDIDTAIPCGLIVNELVSNALSTHFQTIGRERSRLGCT
ncbi:MAG: PAS domain S-box protein [Chloroflexi bacterium]|nr:PAS domain S-box protein [Chloroflexota bacterium]